MSLVIRFSPPSLTAEQYDEVVRRLTEAGVFPADGRVSNTIRYLNPARTSDSDLCKVKYPRWDENRPAYPDIKVRRAK